jgi:hypothetical protein
MRTLGAVLVLLSVGVIAVLVSRRDALDDWREQRDERREMFI